MLISDNMIVYMFSNKQFVPVVIELFVRGRLEKILYFIDYFIMKIPNKQELRQVAFNNWSDNGFKDFMNLNKNVLQNHIF